MDLRHITSSLSSLSPSPFLPLGLIVYILQLLFWFPSSHVWMWELDYEESWVLKNWCFWTGVLEKTLESPLDCMEIKQVHPKGDQSWVFTGRTDAEAETPILWSPDAKNYLSGKDPDPGKTEGRRRRGFRGWDGCMASPTQWRWVWASSGSWWWTRKPGMLQSMGSQSVRYNWATEQQWCPFWFFIF